MSIDKDLRMSSFLKYSFFLFFWCFPFPALTDALAGLPYRTGRFARSFALQDHSKESSIVAPFKAYAEILIQINAHGPLFTFWWSMRGLLLKETYQQLVLFC